MSPQRHVTRTLGVLIAAALCLSMTGCPFTEPIADDAGTSGAGGSSGTTSSGGVSGFVGDTGGSPVTGVEDGSSGITGRQ